MPTSTETRQFKLLTDQVISRFKALTRRPGRAYDAADPNASYELPDDEISKRLMQLMEGMRGCMKPDDYSAAELLVGEIRELSQKRIAEHHAALNEANSKYAGGARDSHRDFSWARDWATGKGMSENDVDEFIEGLQQHAEPPPFAGAPRVGGGQVPLNAQDRARKHAQDQRTLASTSNQADFARRYPGVRMEPSTNESLTALHGHMSKIGVV